MDKRSSDLMDKVRFAIPEPLETLEAITAMVDKLIYSSFNTTNVSELSADNYKDGIVTLRVILSALRDVEGQFSEVSDSFDKLQMEIQAGEREM